MFRGENWFESCLLKKYNITWIKKESTKTYFFFFHKHKTSISENVVVSENFTSNSKNFSKLIGGDTSFTFD